MCIENESIITFTFWIVLWIVLCHLTRLKTHYLDLHYNRYTSIVILVPHNDNLKMEHTHSSCNMCRSFIFSTLPCPNPRSSSQSSPHNLPRFEDLPPKKKKLARTFIWIWITYTYIYIYIRLKKAQTMVYLFVHSTSKFPLYLQVLLSNCKWIKKIVWPKVF